MPTEKELTEKIQQLEQELTKWKYKFNSKNADYVLLYQALEQTKKTNPWPWFLTFALVALATYLLTYD